MISVGPANRVSSGFKQSAAWTGVAEPAGPASRSPTAPAAMMVSAAATRAMGRRESESCVMGAPDGGAPGTSPEGPGRYLAGWSVVCAVGYSAGAGSTVNVRSETYDRHIDCALTSIYSSSACKTNVPWPPLAFSHLATCGVTSHAPLSPVVAPATPAVSAGEVWSSLSVAPLQGAVGTPSFVLQVGRMPYSESPAAERRVVLFSPYEREALATFPF